MSNNSSSHRVSAVGFKRGCVCDKAVFAVVAYRDDSLDGGLAVGDGPRLIESNGFEAGRDFRDRRLLSPGRRF